MSSLLQYWQRPAALAQTIAFTFPGSVGRLARAAFPEIAVGDNSFFIAQAAVRGLVLFPSSLPSAEALGNFSN